MQNVKSVTKDSPSISGSTETAPRRNWSRWALGATVAAPLLLAGCNAYPSYGASRGVTTQGQDTFKLYSGMMTTGIVIGGLVGLLILFTVLRYKRRSDAMPRQFHENIPVEILYTAIPIIIVFVLFWFTVLTENNVDAVVPVNAKVTANGTPVINVDVTAFQWGWRFNYPQQDVGVAGVGLQGPDNKGPQMVVPVGDTVQITLVSNDVIHGFYLRDFNFSRYALPGVTNYFDFNVVKTGTFDGQCTQICGLYHSDMLFQVKAVTASQFKTWVAQQHATGHTLLREGLPESAKAPKGTGNTPSIPLPPGVSAKGA